MEKLCHSDSPNQALPKQICIVDLKSQMEEFGCFLYGKGYDVLGLSKEELDRKNTADLKSLNPVCYVLGEDIPLQEKAYNVVLLDDTSSKSSSKLLDSGADFVAARSTSPIVLEAHIAAILRRPREEHKSYNLGNLTVQNGRVIRYGDDIYFTKRESDLLTSLLNSMGTPVSMSQLVQEVFEQCLPTDTNNIRIIVARIRKKIGEDSKKPKLIKYQRPSGYKIEQE